MNDETQHSTPAPKYDDEKKKKPKGRKYHNQIEGEKKKIFSIKIFSFERRALNNLNG